ncbi:MAG: hypothetical protein RIF42_11220 [Parvibaculaceae bacterium]
MLATAAAVSVAACADVYEPTAKIIPITDGWVISDTASLSHTLVRNRNSNTIVCAEPPPDAAFDQGEAADINISLISVGGSSDKDAGGESESSQEIEMAGRTPAVLISRELFYRTCEFSQNYGLNKGEALTLFNRTLDIVEKNWAVEADKTTVTIGDTIATSQGATVKAKTSVTENATGGTSATTDSSGSTSDTTDSDSDSTN